MFSQSPYICRMEWGRRGAREAAERGDIIIIVDILSFSSTVVSALHFAADVKHCSRLNVYQSVPILKDNHFVSHNGEV